VEKTIFIIVEEEVLAPNQLTEMRLLMASPRFMAFIERPMMPFSTHTAGKFCGHNKRGWFGVRPL